MTSTQKYRNFIGEAAAGKAVEAIPGIGPEIGRRMREINHMETVSYEELVKIFVMQLTQVNQFQVLFIEM